MTPITKVNIQPKLSPSRVLKPLTLTITALAGLALMGVAIAYGANPSSLNEHIFSSEWLNILQNPGHIAVASIEGAVGGLAFLGASRALYKDVTKPTYGEMMESLEKKIEDAGFKIDKEGNLSHTNPLSNLTDGEKEQLKRLLNWKESTGPEQREKKLSIGDERVYAEGMAIIHKSRNSSK